MYVKNMALGLNRKSYRVRSYLKSLSVALYTNTWVTEECTVKLCLSNAKTFFLFFILSSVGNSYSTDLVFPPVALWGDFPSFPVL